MSMIMNHDMTALMGQRILQRNSLALKRSLQKLSTGLRTRIADVDNTAGLAISETMMSRTYGAEKALYNTQDGISMIQTASGGLEGMHSMLLRMRELSVQAANDSLTQQDRGYIQAEINGIRNEIDRVAETTQFNRKKILSGDSAVLWSSTSSSMKAIVNGGLRSIDNYGQKYAVDGNYKISVKTDTGKAQVQKTDIFHVRQDDVITEKSINESVSIEDVSFNGYIPAGKYTLSLSEAETQAAEFTGSYGFSTKPENIFSVTAGDGLEVNASILFEVTGKTDAIIDEEYGDVIDPGSITLKITAETLSQDGHNERIVVDNFTLENGGDEVSLDKLFGENSMTISFALTDEEEDLPTVEGINIGAKFTVNAAAQGLFADAMSLDITGVMDNTAPDYWANGPFGTDTLHYMIDGASLENKKLNFTNIYLNDDGTVSEGTISIITGKDFKTPDYDGVLEPDENPMLATFKTSYAGKVADGNTTLRDIDKFWNDGVFMLEQARALTLTQGDGTQATIMLYADDTLKDLARKLNDAIATGLGQGKYVDDATKFVSYVEGGTVGGDAVEGTIVMRSVLTGKNGELVLSGSEELLTALSLNTIQESSETEYTVSVHDAHSGQTIAHDVHVTGNRLVGVIHKNIDVEFDPMMGVNAVWDTTTNNYALLDTVKGGKSEAILHIADNTTVFQVGAIEGEDVMISIGDMSAHAMGIDKVNVMSHDSAANSISIIDTAIDRISMQQAKLGSAQNRLEHHIGNLTSETDALVAANSRIRDVDYMQEILEFAKDNILMDANSAMLAQANQIQQTTILSLLR